MKFDFREKGKQIISKLSKDERDILSKEISSHVFLTKMWEEAKVIGITVSKADEINTRFIIEKAWDEGKTIAVPKCFPKQNHNMIFYRLNHYQELENSYFGILEPNPRKASVIEKEDIDLMFVPGILFDRNGYRIGYGGGYFDRYLHNYSGKTISLAFRKQIVDKIPYDEYDIPVKHIITEKGLYF